MEFLKQFDGYSLKARVYPALLTLLPLISTILAWYPSLLTSNVGAALLTVINACGLLALFAELSRSQGQRAQRKLLDMWGGFPTTRYLRHADNSLPTDTKGRYHRHLATKLGGPLPTEEEERADPKAADSRYSSAIHWLKEQCRGSEHVLILNENISYGFRRNLYGLKPVGILVCLAVIAWTVGVAWAHYPANAAFTWAATFKAAQVLQPVQIGALGLSLIGLSGWLFVVRAGWVKEAAELYAVRLLAACDLPTA